MKFNFKISLRTLTIVLFFSYPFLTSILYSAIGSSKLSRFLSDGILLFFLFYTYLQKKTILKRDAVIVICLSALIFGITYLIHPEYSNVMFNGDWNIFNQVFILHGGVFSYLIIRMEDEDERILADLKISAFMVWVYYTIRTVDGISFKSVSAITGNVIIRNYNQVYGFSFLFVAVLYTYMFLKKKEKVCGLIGAISIVQILLYASRTAILSYIMYIVLYFMFEKSVSEKNTFLKKVGIGILIYSAATFFMSNTFLRFVSNLAKQRGISSKIVDTFIYGQNKIDGGRMLLWTSSIELIKKHPFGLGVYSDFYYLNVYSHNIVLQLLLSFGWFLGGVCIAFLIYMIGYMLIKSDGTWKSLFIMFLSMSIVRLSLSYSFWYDINFWFMIAMYMGYRKSIR